jgi:DNA-binding transcriptional regulator YhcF (GntR family)
LALLREAAKASQAAEPQLFHSLREVVQKFRIPLSLGAAIYRQLEREGILRPIRGSGTLLEGLNGTRNARVKGIVTIAASLSRFVTHQDYRTFVITMGRELRGHDLAAAETFYEGADTGSGLVDRLKECHPDKVIWYRPPKLFREVLPRLHDIGLPIVGVNDGGFSRACYQYEISREPALIKIVREWKSEGLNQVKVAIGPTRSPIAEERPDTGGVGCWHKARPS